MRWLMAASRPRSSVSQRHFSSVPQMPTTRAPRCLAIWAAIEPVAPAAADTTTVSPAFTCATSTMPIHAVAPTEP